MGKPLLNVSSTTSAFYDDIYLPNFLSEFGVSTVELHTILKGLKIWIIHEQRVKSISGVSGKEPCEEIFEKDGAKISVAYHLAATRSKYVHYCIGFANDYKRG